MSGGVVDAASLPCEKFGGRFRIDLLSNEAFAECLMNMRMNKLGWGVVIISLFLGVGALAPARTAKSGPPFFAGKRVLWLGDSITQQGDYITLAEYYLDKMFPEAKFDFISIGLPSETASCLSEKAHPFPRPCVQERLQRALALVRPDVVVACYGMNDGIYHPQSAERMAAFQRGIDKIIERATAAGAQVVILTPPPFDRLPVKHLQKQDAADFSYLEPYENYDSVLGEYARWEMQLSRHKARVIDLHTPLADYIAQRRKVDGGFSFTRDGIHPDLAGHLLMARVILKGLGVVEPSGDLDQEVERISADPLYGLVKREREERSAGWLDYVGYTRERTVKTESVEGAERSALEMQKRIDEVRRVR